MPYTALMDKDIIFIDICMLVGVIISAAVIVWVLADTIASI